ncbi:hypothetical protein JCGZ_10638 [Jatropha curcas]|uniref:Uncharacterized protein n=1 Tax=Jatropha curcas TaxID=180498 RepID=A0A067KVF2_JATCU|nr:hypothetical protein JCGZ_10638 [Jatropha curcas]
MMEEMCPLFEEFCAIIGCDPNAPLVKHEDPGFGDLRLCPMVRQMEDTGCIGDIVLAETIRSLDRAALGFDDWMVSPIILQMGIDQTVPMAEDFSADSAITPSVTQAGLRAWVRDHHMVRPLPNPAGVQTSPEYRAWFIAVVWPVERPRRNALLSVLEGWVQADHEVETDEEIVLAPRTGETGESSAASDDSEDVTPRRRRDT